MNSVISTILSLKYQRFTPLGLKDIGIRKFDFVAKTQLLCFWFKFICIPCRQQLSDCKQLDGTIC